MIYSPALQGLHGALFMVKMYPLSINIKSIYNFLVDSNGK